MRFSMISLPRVMGRRTLRQRSLKAFFITTGLLFWILYQLTLFALEEDEEKLLKYQPPIQSGVPKKGRRLEVEKVFWRRKALRYLTLTEKLAENFVIVTAGSAGYYRNNIEAIATIQQFLPGHPVFFYDLEDRNKVDDLVVQKFNAICGVTYRVFNFDLYPEHIRQLKYYAWKPLIIYEMLKEFPGVLWIDSSIRFITSNFTTIFQKAVETDGMLALTSTGHSNFAVTHPQMYSFLPTSMEGMVQTDQHEANCVLLYRTKAVFENVVWWWTLCALDPLCIAPTDRTDCDNPYKSRNIHAGCHRFDQSALNILLANYFAYDYMRYFGSSVVAEVHRYSHSNRNVKICLPATTRTVEKYSDSRTPGLIEHIKRQEAGKMGEGFPTPTSL